MITKTQFKKNLHIAMRYTSEFNNHHTIKEHLAILDKYNCVWWGKFGAGISKIMTEKIQSQIDLQEPTYLILCEGVHIRYIAEIMEIQCTGANSKHPCPDTKITPRYYNEQRCSLWLKLKSIKEINPMALASLRMYSDITKTSLFANMRGLVFATFFPSLNVPPSK